MNFSKKQKPYVENLLKRLNFDFYESFSQEYLTLLFHSFQTFKSIGNCEKTEIIYNNEKRNIPKNYVYNEKYLEKENFFEIENFSLISFLKLEINIKKNKLYKIKFYDGSNLITATDIANYTFCPVSYSISKSITFKTLESARIGEKKHNESILKNILKKGKFNDFLRPNLSENSGLELDSNYSSLIKLLSTYEIIYSGHSDNDKIFKNLKGNYYGKPDFILKDKTTNKFIVIEEKYQFIPKEFQSYGGSTFYDELEEKINSKRNSTYFYDNHINQISSYLFGISEYELEFGILIYWKYEIQDNKQIVKKCIFKTVYKNEASRFNLNEIYKKIKAFKIIKEINYDAKQRNPAKCANCVNSFLCGHKTGQFDKLQIPYSLDYLNLNQVEFVNNIKNEEVINYLEKILSNIIPDNGKLGDTEEITA